MEKLYDIKLKDNYVKILKDTIFGKGYFCGLELIEERNEYFYFKMQNGQYIKIADEWIDLLIPHTELEEYPYDLYYLGEKVGKMKWPLQFPECTVEKIFEVK